MSASAGSDKTMQQPSVFINNLSFVRNDYFTTIPLLNNAGGILTINNIYVKNHQGTVIVNNNNGVENCVFNCNGLQMINCGKESSPLISLDRINGDSYTSYLVQSVIKNVYVDYEEDNDINIYAIIQVAEPETSSNLVIENISNPKNKTVINANGILNPALALRIGGLDGYSCMYSVRKNPEGYVYAQKGSIAICTDGKMYLKTTDSSSNTGWSEK